jgi:hypothetical protein
MKTITSDVISAAVLVALTGGIVTAAFGPWSVYGRPAPAPVIAPVAKPAPAPVAVTPTPVAAPEPKVAEEDKSWEGFRMIAPDTTKRVEGACLGLDADMLAGIHNIGQDCNAQQSMEQIDSVADAVIGCGWWYLHQDEPAFTRVWTKRCKAPAPAPAYVPAATPRPDDPRYAVREVDCGALRTKMFNSPAEAARARRKCGAS